MLARYLLVIVIFCVTDAYARDFNHPVYISVSDGSAMVSGNDYDNSPGWSARIGVRLHHESFTAGYTNLGDFEYRHAANTRIKASAYTLAIEKLFQSDGGLNLNVTAGLCKWKTNSSFLGSNLGHDYGTGTFIGFAPGVKFNTHASLFLGMERYFDVNGLDITTTNAVLTWDF